MDDSNKSPDAIKRAKEADLITFPKDIKAVNCANCRFVKGDYCTHPKVDQQLKAGADHMCCNLWDSKGTKREWDMDKSTEEEFITQEELNSLSKVDLAEFEELAKKCPRCGGASANSSNPSGRCRKHLNKLAKDKKTPGHWQRAQTKADDALRRQDGKNGTASHKSSGRGKRDSIVKQTQSAEKKTGQKLSPDRKDNGKGYAASNTRMVPEKLNRGRHKVDGKKLKAWRDRMKKSDISEELMYTALLSKATRENDETMLTLLRALEPAEVYTLMDCLESLNKAKDDKEPDHYNLKDGSSIKRATRYQTADSPEDHYNDEWSVHDPNNKHVGYFQINHSPRHSLLERVSPMSNFPDELPSPETLKMDPSAQIEGPPTMESYKEHEALARKHLNHAIPVLASHYGSIITKNREHGNNVHTEASNHPDIKHHRSYQRVPEVLGWVPRRKADAERYAAMPKRNFNHFTSNAPGKIDYKKLAADKSVSTGGAYTGESGPSIPTTKDKSSMN